MNSYNIPSLKTASVSPKRSAMGVDEWGTLINVADLPFLITHPAFQVRTAFERAGVANRFIFYSNAPETVDADATRILTVSSHKSSAYIRAYVYHLAKGGSRTFRLGIYNKNGNPIKISGTKIRPTVPITENSLLTMAHMVGLSIKPTLDLSDSAKAELIFNNPPFHVVSSTQGWTILYPVPLPGGTVPEGTLWHRIFDIDVEALDGKSPDYALASFTVGPEGPVPQSWDTPKWVQIATERKVIRAGLFKDTQFIETVPATGTLVLTAPQSRYFYVSTLSQCDVKTLGLRVGKQFGPHGGWYKAAAGAQPQWGTVGHEDTGNFGAWVDVQMNLRCNAGSKQGLLVDLWIDAVRVFRGNSMPYAGAVILLGQPYSTPTTNPFLQPGDTVIVPPIKRNDSASSAFLDRFVLPVNPDGSPYLLKRTYRIMHAGGSSVPIGIWLDARTGKRRRPVPAKPWLIP